MTNRRSLGTGLRTEQLRGLAEELHRLRDYPPIVSKGNGKYEGDILGFVKGLRFSARIIYYLRNQLSDIDCEIHWGHLLDDDEASCSPECDIIIHKKGFIERWNDYKDPVMDFYFIKAEKAKLVVSCKSVLNKVDKEYPKTLKEFGIGNIFLFAECCKDTRYKSMKEKANKAGYAGLWCLYCTTKENDYNIDDNEYIDFIDAIRKVLSK